MPSTNSGKSSVAVCLLLMAGLLAGCSSTRARVGVTEEGKDYLKASPEQMRKWRNLKFGLFVHWDPVSLLGTELSWSRGGERRGRKGTGEIPVEVYDNLYRSFCPGQFDAEEWVELARSAGMRYIVFTTKHHDGFCMFDSALTDYKITNSPFRRDIAKELADACHQAGLKLGFYYSQPDWHHPDYRTERHGRYIEYSHGQIRELCTKYGRVDIIFFDGLGGKSDDWDSEDLFRMIRRLQPDVVINDRGGLRGDFSTPEQKVGEFQKDRPWETNMTIGQQWAWKTGDRIKSLRECIQALVASVGGDGNFLLNVGPMPTGRIEPRQADRLRQMGVWLGKYAHSIYGSSGGPFVSGTWGASAYKDNRIYVHVFNWHGPSFTLPAIPRNVTGSRLLTGGEVRVTQSQDGIVIGVADKYRKDIDTIIVLELDGPAESIEPLDVPSRSLAHNCSASASSMYRDRTKNSPDKAFDDNGVTCWRASGNQGWLEVDLGQPRTIDTALIQQGSQYFGADEFELLCRSDGKFKSLIKGTKLGQLTVLNFEPVKARHFRLKVSRENRQPIICEFQLFGPQGNLQ